MSHWTADYIGGWGTAIGTTILVYSLIAGIVFNLTVLLYRCKFTQWCMPPVPNIAGRWVWAGLFPVTLLFIAMVLIACLPAYGIDWLIKALCKKPKIPVAKAVK